MAPVVWTSLASLSGRLADSFALARGSSPTAHQVSHAEVGAASPARSRVDFEDGAREVDGLSAKVDASREPKGLNDRPAAFHMVFHEWSGMGGIYAVSA